jgi:hypothetical protein
MGFYSVTVNNSAGSVDSAVAILTVSGGRSRLTALSTRGYVPAGGCPHAGLLSAGQREPRRSSSAAWARR